jgi:hypothetical protein
MVDNLTKMTADVNVISKLDNYPPDDPGMTPSKLKELFDKGSNTIKDYINNTLLPQLEQGYVSSIARTSGDGSPGSTDTYTITFHDGTATTFDIYNGVDGVKGDKGDTGEQGVPGLDGKSLEFHWNGTQLGIRIEGETTYQYVNLKGAKGDTGSKGESGDDGRGIVSIARTSGTGAAGTTDTYTITFTDSTTATFQVYNGADGEGAGDMLLSVYDPQGKNTDIFGYIDNKVKTDVPVNAKFTDTVTTINGKTGAILKSDIVALGIPAQDTVVPNTRKVNNKALSSDITLDKSDIGLGNVDNAKQMPIVGGTFTGAVTAQSNTAYTTRQIRNIVLSTSDPSGGSNGDIWIKYT